MKKLNNIKVILIILMSFSIILTFTNFVYAVDDDPFTTLEATTSGSGTGSSSGSTAQSQSSSDDDFEPISAGNSNTNGNSNANNTNTANDLLSNNTNNKNTNSNNNVNNNSNNNSVNRNVSNTETLAKTGLTDSNGFVAFIVVLCGISAIYSFKKINEYKKI